MRGYARLWGEPEEDWAVVALLHDFDYEKYPDPANHPFRGVEVLKEQGYPEWVTRAILSHADYSGVARESRLEHALFACDEMSGFVTAAALVRPSKSVLDLEAASVIKRMKDKAFARAVSRDDLRKGAEEIGLPLDQHITNVIAFMRERADVLGLRGALVALTRVPNPDTSISRISYRVQTTEVMAETPAGRCRVRSRRAPRRRHRHLRQEPGAEGRQRAVRARRGRPARARTAPARARCSRRCSGSSSRPTGA